MGLIPMFYPDYQKADDPAVRGQVRAGLGHPTSTRKRGLTVTEIIGSGAQGRACAACT